MIWDSISPQQALPISSASVPPTWAPSGPISASVLPPPISPPLRPWTWRPALPQILGRGRPPLNSAVLLPELDQMSRPALLAPLMLPRLQPPPT
jgi:hypothetical protein